MTGFPAELDERKDQMRWVRDKVWPTSIGSLTR